MSNLSSQHSRPELCRALGPIASAALLAGTVIGTGIFLVPSTMARETGSVALVFAVWITGAVLSLAGALTYAELGSSFPEAGGEYVYLKRAYGPFWGFLFGWQQVVIGKTGSIAGLALAFSIFLGYFVPGLDSNISSLAGVSGWLPVTGLQATAIGGILSLSLINTIGIATGGTLQSLLTAIKISAILALAALAFGSGQGSWEHFQGHAPEPRDLKGWLLHGGAALAAALWAFDGWNNLTLVGGEIRRPQKTIPRVLITGLLGVAGVYIVANLAYFYALPLEAVQHSERVAQDVATALLGTSGGIALSIAALISTLAALNGSILSGSRIYFAMARDGLFFPSLSDLNPGNPTPVRALWLQGTMASLLILLFGQTRQAFEHLMDYALFGTWGFYAVTTISVIVLRRRYPDHPRPYRTPGYPWTPLAFSLVAVLFCGSIALRRPEQTLFGLCLLMTGLPFYLFWARRSTSPNA